MAAAVAAVAVAVTAMTSAVALAAPGAAPAPLRATAVYLVSRVGGAAGRGRPASDRPKRALAADGVTLYAVLAARDAAGHLHYYSDAGSPVLLRGRRRPTRPLSAGPPAVLFWFKVEPTIESMSNTISGKFRFEPIPYRETPVPHWQGRGQVQADVRPTLTTDRGHGVGTMRFKVLAVTAHGTVASPGVEARRDRGSGGLSDAVHRISLRRDNTYLGYLTEMYGQPYIWASAGKTAATHQTERLEGADCADFVVYGRRRMGEARPYTWTGGLPAMTRLLERGRPGADGVYVDRTGRPLPYPRTGDLVLFNRHVGVLAGDRGVRGVLDGKDLMMHAYFASPREQALGQSDYAREPVEIRRWR